MPQQFAAAARGKKNNKTQIQPEVIRTCLCSLDFQTNYRAHPVSNLSRPNQEWKILLITLMTGFQRNSLYTFKARWVKRCYKTLFQCNFNQNIPHCFCLFSHFAIRHEFLLKCIPPLFSCYFSFYLNESRVTGHTTLHCACWVYTTDVEYKQRLYN